MSLPPRVSAINVFPVKSCGPMALEAAEVAPSGLMGDRRFLVTDADGGFVTGRRIPAMTRIQPHFDGQCLRLEAPGMPSLAVDTDTLAPRYSDVTVWRDTVAAQSCGDDADAWISECLGGRYRLGFMGPQSHRATKGRPDQPLGFADRFPLLGVSRESVNALNDRLARAVTALHFRANLVIDGGEAFQEDGWAEVRIGEAVFEVVAPCSRCVFTTVDPQRGEAAADREPFRTLAGFRRDDSGKVHFGQHLVPRITGTVRVGDCVEVLARKPKPRYVDRMAAT
ncbi:MOSC domain-containing protein [Arhodomonas sp. AD133]|uniref:MOSC domain-containing protein n=1 Tax=Arhodomonas sp. AD133 TaxID=3415009 RepID=UPI003EBDA2F4